MGTHPRSHFWEDANNAIKEMPERKAEARKIDFMIISISSLPVWNSNKQIFLRHPWICDVSMSGERMNDDEDALMTKRFTFSRPFQK